MAVDLFSEPISKLSDVVIRVAQTTWNFKRELKLIKKTLERITPIIEGIQQQNLKLDHTKEEQDMFLKELHDAKEVVEKCSKIKWNIYKRFTHSLKLKELYQNLIHFFQIEVQGVQCQDIKRVQVEVNHVSKTVKNMAVDVKDLGKTLSGISMHMSSRSRTKEREKLGWVVPTLPIGIVGFNIPLENLKAKVLSNNAGVGKVVVVSAAGGCGKTTLVKMLCNDPQIQGNFGENVFFVTVSETPDFMVSVNDLLNPNCFDQQVKFHGSEDAKNKLEDFLHREVSGPILVVLDDVWQETYIKNFEFNIRGYTLLVTSRKHFTKYDVFKFDPLSDEDANILFRNSARTIPTIDKNIEEEIVKCCKKHPLTLSVVGSSLNGKSETFWRSMLKSLSQGQSVLDLNQEILNRLERSFKELEEEFKKYYLDLALFLEDQRIPASALLDMWVHLYRHDDEGNDTLTKIYELSYRNLVNFTLSDRDDSVNYCEHQFVTQHDLMRQLAIKLNSELPVAERPRLIISARNDVFMTNVQGEDQMTSIEEMQEPMKARILSISTGESFSSRWCNMRVPEVEVMVMNLHSETYTLPPFLKEMKKLKIVNVTNSGLYSTEIEDFHLLACLSNLTRIRLERVAISSLSPSLANLKKISFIMCKMSNAFESINDNLNVWPNLEEIEIDYCQDLKEYPRILCTRVNLKKLSITNCNELCEISEEFGNLTSLETLILHSCTKLEKLPESITKLQNLSILNISDCLGIRKLPVQMGSLGGLRMIYMTGCTGVGELPPSLMDLSNTKVVCNEELACQWKEFSNVKISVAEEDRTAILKRIIG